MRARDDGKSAHGAAGALNDGAAHGVGDEAHGYGAAAARRVVLVDARQRDAELPEDRGDAGQRAGDVFDAPAKVMGGGGLFGGATAPPGGKGPFQGGGVDWDRVIPDVSPGTHSFGTAQKGSFASVYGPKGLESASVTFSVDDAWDSRGSWADHYEHIASAMWELKASE